MLTVLFLAWTALLSGLRPDAAAVVSVGLLSVSDSRWFQSEECETFFPPPLPPPLFPPLEHKNQLMVDITDDITGAKGEKGCRGPRGVEGEPGSRGPEGEPGTQGVIGPPGQKGEKGNRGWRGLYGDIGTPGMIKGVKGFPGFRGNKGQKGSRGVSGAKGERGLPAAPGLKGNLGLGGDLGQMGSPGPRGDTGIRGAVGVKGALGPPGSSGHPGLGGSVGLNGYPGLPGQVLVLPGRRGDSGDPGPWARCRCPNLRRVQNPDPPQNLGQVQTVSGSQIQDYLILDQGPDQFMLQIFLADGDRAMRNLRGENVMVLRTDKPALFIYSNSQWINVLEEPRY